MAEHEPSASKYPVVSLENIKRVLLPVLRVNLYLCIDDIPVEPVKEEDPNCNKYKCRMNWFSSSLKGIDTCMGQITDPLFSELEAELDFFRTKVDWQAVRTRQEIDRVNGMLAKVIAFFEAR